MTRPGFAADDTPRQTGHVCRLPQQEFTRLRADHGTPKPLPTRLGAVQRRNTGQHGFDNQGLTLPMIETALEVTDDRRSGLIARLGLTLPIRSASPPQSCHNPLSGGARARRYQIHENAFGRNRPAPGTRLFPQLWRYVTLHSKQKTDGRKLSRDEAEQ